MSIDYDELWRVLGKCFRLGQGSYRGLDHWRRMEWNALELAAVTDADRLELPHVGITLLEAYMSTEQGKRRARSGEFSFES